MLKLARTEKLSQHKSRTMMTNDIDRREEGAEKKQQQSSRWLSDNLYEFLRHTNTMQFHRILLLVFHSLYPPSLMRTFEWFIKLKKVEGKKLISFQLMVSSQ